jgi:nucleoside-diphosphate kinase
MLEFEEDKRGPREVTFALIKPDAVAAHKAGEIIMEMERNFYVADVFCTTWSRKQVAGFYAEHKERPFFNDLVEFMSSGRMYAITLVAPGAVQKWREMMGATDPKRAQWDSMRGRFGSKKGVVMHNAVHGSDSPASVAREIDYVAREVAGAFFGEEARMLLRAYAELS